MDERKLMRIGNSIGITLPKSFIGFMGWNEGQKVQVEYDLKKDRIIIKKSKEGNKWLKKLSR